MTTNLAVVVPASDLAACDYRLYNVYICPPTHKYRLTSHMAFYANGQVERIVPAIRGQVEGIILSKKSFYLKKSFVNGRLLMLKSEICCSIQLSS